MNQIKIGKFIANRRKERNITQIELAEKLGITDRAISKWENGICMPDASIMTELCSVLDISINDLFSGEIIMKDREKKLEETLLDMKFEKEKSDKILLMLEIVIGFLSCLVLLVNVTLASYLSMPDWLRVTLIIIGFIPFIIGTTIALKIEQVAGYYECMKCHHKYIPTFNKVLWAMHINRIRYMKCPKCNKKSWNRKVLTK